MIKIRNLNYLNEYRVLFDGKIGDEYNGVFMIPADNKVYQVIASDGMDWDHDSVTLCYLNNEIMKRCPRWKEMCEIKDMFLKQKRLL